jgi:hypothetical protein
MRTTTKPAGARRLPLPVTDPPYDDELGTTRPPTALIPQPKAGRPVQGILALTARTRPGANQAFHIRSPAWFGGTSIRFSRRS